MKVYEIISEDAKTGLLKKAGGWLVNKLGGGVITKAMGKSEFIDAEAHAIANLAKTRGVSVAKAMQMSRQEELDAIKYSIKRMNTQIKPAELERQAQAELLSRKPHLSDPAVLSKIEKQAGTQSGINALEKTGEFGEKVWATGMFGLKAWGLWEMWGPPLMDYREAMANAKANLDSGAWNQSKYDYVENQQLSTLIGRLGAALLITSVPAMLVNNQLTRGILGKHLGGILDLGTTAGVIAFRRWLNQDNNADAIAAVMMNDYVAGNGSIMGNPIPGLGSVAAGFKNQITGGVKADPSKVKPQAGGGQDASPASTTNPSAVGATKAKQDIASTSITPANQGNTSTPGTGKTAMGRKMWSDDPLAINNYDITGWVSKPGNPNFIQDPKNPANFLPKPDGWTP
jgi:hypothetical protein